jgi:hypothetical protein
MISPGHDSRSTDRPGKEDAALARRAYDPAMRRRVIGRMAVALLVSGLVGCTRPDWIQSTLVTVDVSGSWQGNVTRPAGAYGPGLVQLQLQQSGPKVTGTLSFSPGPTKDVPIDGTVSGDVLRLRTRTGSVTAELQVSGDEMSGTGTTAAGAVVYEIHRQP